MHLNFRGHFSLLVVVFLAACAPCARADDKKAADGAPRFLRMTRTEEGNALGLESAIVRYVARDAGREGPTVDLVAAVHVAEAAYYEELNRRFRDYDAVLYELIAPEGTRIPKGGVKTGGSAVSMLQTMMTRVLELDFQLNKVDYTVGNFVHADMTPEQFAATMKNRGESAFQTFFRMIGYAMAKQGDRAPFGGDLRLLAAVFDKDRALAMKRVLAEEFQHMEGSLAAINGPDGSTLITERNNVALAVLRRQFDAGKKKVAIFYGAGHMFDFEQRLQDDFGLAPVETTWLTAWDLTAAEDRGNRSPPGASRPEGPQGKNSVEPSGQPGRARVAPEPRQ
jgi:hypothetical protein